MTYYEELIRILGSYPNNEMTIEEILKCMVLPKSKYVCEVKTKQNYLIDAIKIGLKNFTIQKIVNFNEKRLYVGHSYKMVKE